ncbi:MAG: pyruvate:ferredoxin (flavodoxin) oxidoreductase [Planctomycetes bacterium]|nr:pyruvate:ferredoxin (flavodoxin) oxidoreductase [Planctomycetota bacterium]
MARRTAIIDGNEGAASVAYRASEVIAIYPITPSSAMGEFADEWAAQGKPNLWSTVPTVQEMQSEGGAAGAVHGALQSGALATSFTASQGLLLYIPNLYKIAGELLPFVLHVSARTLATHALSIFGDHSDVMACRGTGFAMLCSCSPQEAHDLAAIAHAATLRARVPFMHFFDGFRTSHELAKVELLSDDELRGLLDPAKIAAHRSRGLSPDHPVLRGSAQNPDTFFQAREACNPFHDAVPRIVEQEMARFAQLSGREYSLVEWHGHPEAERAIVIMGSGSETARTTVDWLQKQGEKVGVLTVRLFRPFPAERVLAALPSTVKKLAVLDRTKEPGAVGEPLFLDVVAALAEGRACEDRSTEGRACEDRSTEGRAGEDRSAGGRAGAMPLVIGGRYGLSSKEFTPAMVRSVFDELKQPKPKRRFTVGIVDDVTHLSLPVGPEPDVLPKGVFQALFYGLGSDGTVGANKNTIKIIGDETTMHVQGYFVYDSKKSGATTVSHLRFGPEELHAPYLVLEADFIGCHQFEFVERMDVLEKARTGAVLLLNSPYAASDTWDRLPRELQETIVEKKIQLWTIDALSVSRAAGMGGRINTVMQTCFFGISGVLPRDEAIAHIKKSIEKTYGKKGAEVVRKNQEAIDATLANLVRLDVPAKASSTRRRPPVVAPEAPEFVQRVTAVMIEGKGDLLPVSAFPPDGTWPTGTAKWEKRNLATEIPVWDEALCIQCNKCAMVCPHAAIRAKVYDPAALAGAPNGFLHVPYKANDFQGQHYTIQVAPEDCTGCQLCSVVCPAKDKSNPRHKALDMQPQRERREAEKERFAFFLDLPEVDRTLVKHDVKGTQLLEPLFEYSGACAGCGETPYIKLLTQMFGDRLLVANATGCTSIYGGNLPTTPYSKNKDGRGPAWANSLFEDNAEFGLGIRMGVDAQRKLARETLKALAPQVGDELVRALLEQESFDEAGVREQRGRVELLRSKLRTLASPAAKDLDALADLLVRKSVWLVGGDGWAYDIGFGGLDHVLASNWDVNILVLDTGVYSNTGGQQSKATPLGAAAKFASAGKEIPKKDLGLIAMSYGHVYVAQVAFGAKDAQTVKALAEADAHPGPSLIIAYSHCIAHGYDMVHGLDQQKLAAECGVWPLYRVDPKRAAMGEPAMELDLGGTPKRTVKEYTQNETRFRMIEKLDPLRFARLQEDAQRDAVRRTDIYRQLAELRVKPRDAERKDAPAASATAHGTDGGGVPTASAKPHATEGNGPLSASASARETEPKSAPAAPVKGA